jgi:hypothetical protein
MVHISVYGAMPLRAIGSLWLTSGKSDRPLRIKYLAFLGMKNKFNATFIDVFELTDAVNRT